MGVLGKLKKTIRGSGISESEKEYMRRFETYAFEDLHCRSREQFEGSIIRLYHTIEKGLSYIDYRAGFGKDNVEKLVTSLEQYASAYDSEADFYRTGLACMREYIRKNREYGLTDAELEKRVNALPGEPNDSGGTIDFDPPDRSVLAAMNYEELVTSRHSIRHFSADPVDIKILEEAVRLAQYTPSACNRQGWKTRIIADREKIRDVLANQNGNRGFGQEFDKLLLITADLRYFQKGRELYQAFIDGGMYAESVLNALYYKGIGCCPLSASLTPGQETRVRELTGMDDAEVLILFAGVGNYPDQCRTTRSERKQIEVEILWQ